MVSALSLHRAERGGGSRAGSAVQNHCKLAPTMKKEKREGVEGGGRTIKPTPHLAGERRKKKESFDLGGTT